MSLLFTDRAFHLDVSSVLLVLGDSFLLDSIFLVVKCRFEMFVGLKQMPTARRELRALNSEFYTQYVDGVFLEARRAAADGHRKLEVDHVPVGFVTNTLMEKLRHKFDDCYIKFDVDSFTITWD